MLIIDDRVGSKEFLSIMSSHSVPCTLEHLEFGDFAFVGRGPKQQDWSVGIERKALSDFLQCLHDHRFVGYQLPGMLSTYHSSFLIVEGVYRPDSNGYMETISWSGGWVRIQLGKKPILYSAFSNSLNTLRLRSGIQVIQTNSKIHTAFEVASLYRWFSDKEWEEHRSHLADYDPASVLNIKTPFSRRVAIQLEGIGAKKAARVEDEFHGSVWEMANADSKRWQRIEGVGKTIADRIVTEFKGNSKKVLG